MFVDLPFIQLFSFNHPLFFASNKLKKILPSTDDAVLEEIKSALRYFGRPNVQKQGRAAHILLRYEPTYTTFSAADGIPIPSGDQHISALLFPSFKSLRQIGLEDSDLVEDAESVVEEVADPTREVTEEVEEVDEAYARRSRLLDLTSLHRPLRVGQNFLLEIFLRIWEAYPAIFLKVWLGKALRRWRERKMPSEWLLERRPRPPILSPP